jgi:hypothetical protein
MFKEKDLIMLCEALKIDIKFIQKKRYITLIFSSLLAIIAYLYASNIGITILILFIGLFIAKYEYWNLKSSFKQKASTSQLAFISFFGYILVFLENNFNLYQAIKTSLTYIDLSIKDHVETLIKEIDDDKTVQPYMNFAIKFGSQIVEQICLMLYQLEQNGYNAALLDKFSPLLERLRAQTTDEYIQNQSTSLDIFGIFPLISTVVITIALVLGIMQSLVVMIGG